MKNMVVLFKTEDGKLYCKQATKAGLQYSEDSYEGDSSEWWEEGGTILLEELMEILDSER